MQTARKSELVSPSISENWQRVVPNRFVYDDHKPIIDRIGGMEVGNQRGAKFDFESSLRNLIIA